MWKGRKRLDLKAREGKNRLDQAVEFKACIQKGYRIQVPAKIRGAHKLEDDDNWQVKNTVERRFTVPWVKAGG